MNDNPSSTTTTTTTIAAGGGGGGGGTEPISFPSESEIIALAREYVESRGEENQDRDRNRAISEKAEKESA